MISRRETEILDYDALTFELLDWIGCDVQVLRLDGTTRGLLDVFDACVSFVHAWTDPAGASEILLVMTENDGTPAFTVRRSEFTCAIRESRCGARTLRITHESYGVALVEKQ